MGKISKEEAARLQGMNYALKIAKEKGIDGLENDIRMRGAIGLPVGYDQKALDKCVLKAKMNTIDTITLLSVMVLKDEFGFGYKRIQQFLNRFDKKTECLVFDYCTWDDYIQTLEEETGIKLSIRRNDDNVKV